MNSINSIKKRKLDANSVSNLTKKNKLSSDSFKKSDKDFLKISYDNIQEIDNHLNNKKYSNDEEDNELVFINTKKESEDQELKKNLIQNKEKLINDINITKQIKKWFYNLNINPTNSIFSNYRFVFVTGPMCAGKSKFCAELLDFSNEKTNFKENIFFKPDIYINDSNKSRPRSRCGSANKIFIDKIKNNHEFISCNNEESIITSFKKIKLQKKKIVIFEEAQFFNIKLKEIFINQFLDLINCIPDIKIIIIYLNFDYKKQAFGFMGQLHKFMLNDNRFISKNIGFVSLCANCSNKKKDSKCEKIAKYTHKNSFSKNSLSQDTNTYFPVCNYCYNKLNNKNII